MIFYNTRKKNYLFFNMINMLKLLILNIFNCNYVIIPFIHNNIIRKQMKIIYIIFFFNYYIIIS